MSARRAFEDDPATAAERGSAAESSWLADRRVQVESHLDYLMTTMPESRLEAQKLCAEVLGATPSPELLQTLQLMAREDAGPLRNGPGREVVVLRLLADAVFHELTAPTLLEPETLGRIGGALAELEALAGRYRDGAEERGNTATPSETTTLKRLERRLMPSLERIDAYRILVPLLEELAWAAMHGRIMAVDHLSDREAVLFADAIPGRIDAADPPERVWLNAAALRFGMERDLIAWDEARKAASDALEALRAEAEPAGDTPEERAPGVTLNPADDPRLPMLTRIQADMNAYKVVVERLQARQDEARAAGEPLVAERTAGAQKALFASYLRLSAEARKRNLPGEHPVEENAEAAAERERLLEEARHADDGDVKTSEEKRDEIVAEALTGMRGGTGPVPVIVPGAGDLKRERRTRAVLIGVTVVLAVASAALNVAFMMQGRRAAASAPPTPADYAPAMNVKQTDPLGPVMMIEVSAADWFGMPPPEREIRLEELGRLANDDGFSHVMVSDEQGGALGHWSAGQGVTLGNGEGEGGSTAP